MPDITAVSSGAEALARVADARRSRLILTTSHIGDMSAVDLARRVREARPGLPVVLLAYDIGEMSALAARAETREVIDSAFLWQGDVRLLAAIVRSVEDRLNVENDAIGFGVQVILLIEDNVRYTSSFLPVIYDELLAHSHRLLSEGMNLSHKRMRMRARPKILLCRNYEEALEAFERYREEILGVVSDVEFPRERRAVPRGRARLCPRRAAAGARRARRAAVLPQGERDPRDRGRGLVPPEGLAGPPPRPEALHDRVLRLRRLHLPPARRVGGGAGAGHEGARGEARRGPRGLDRVPRRAQPLLEMAQGADRVRARAAPASGAGDRLRDARGPEAEPHRRHRRVPEGPEPDARRRFRPPDVRRPRELLPHRRRLPRRQGARPRVRPGAPLRAPARRPLPGRRGLGAGVRRPRHDRLRLLPRRERPARLRDQLSRTTTSSSTASARRRSPRPRCTTSSPTSPACATRSPCAPRASSRTRSTSPSRASTTR